MSETMSRIGAVRAFLERDARKIETTEMMTFWKSLSDAEKIEFADGAAKELGVTLSIPI